jgi:translation initiation factor IF-3
LRKRTNTKNNLPFYRKNEQIRANEVRLIDNEDKQIGVVSLREAFELAREKELDLVEIAPQAKPPVVKIVDYSKFLYYLNKKKKEEKKNTKTSTTKQLRFGPFIGEHDLEIKLKKAREFLNDGDKVKFAVKFAGRQITKRNLGEIVLNKVLTELEDVAKQEREMRMEGRQLVVIVTKK